MQERLRAFVRDRTQMLAAISHDLRTPLTRLRLRAELIEDEEQQTKMIADLDEMGSMIEAALAFARDEAAARKDGGARSGGAAADGVRGGGRRRRHRNLPWAAARDLRRPADGAPPRLHQSRRQRADRTGGGRGLAWRRAAASWSSRSMTTVPAFRQDELERVFEPFYRLEASRSRETGGAGLGLALVRAAIAAHGGTVRLANRPEGGLRARVVLPAARGPVAAVADAASETTVLLANPPAAR